MTNNKKWTFRIIVRAFILNNHNEILLTQRAKDPQRGKWALPGGKVEYKEKANAAIIREIKEELGFTIIPQFLFYKEDFTSVMGEHCLVLCFLAKIQKYSVMIKKEEIIASDFWNIQRIKEEKNKIAFNHVELLKEFYERN